MISYWRKGIDQNHLILSVLIEIPLPGNWAPSQIDGGQGGGSEEFE